MQQYCDLLVFVRHLWYTLNLPSLLILPHVNDLAVQGRLRVGVPLRLFPRESSWHTGVLSEPQSLGPQVCEQPGIHSKCVKLVILTRVCNQGVHMLPPVLLHAVPLLTWTSPPQYTAPTLSHGEGYYFSPSSGKLLG